MNPTKTNSPQNPLGANSKVGRWAESTLQRQLFLTLLALYLFTLGGYLYSGDGLASYGTAWSLVEGQGGALEDYFTAPQFGFPGREGHFFSKYGLGQAVIDLPFVLVAKGLGLLIPGFKADQTGRLLTSLLNGLVVAFSALVLYRLVRQLGYGVRTRVGVALLYGVGTMAWAYARFDFSEPLLALFYLLMGRALFAWGCHPEKERGLLKVGLWLGFAVTVKPAAGLALLSVLLYIIYRVVKPNQADLQKRVVWLTLVRLFLWLGLPLFGATLLVLGYNYYRFNSISETGYGAIKDQFVAGSFYGGIFGFLLSPGKSLFLYSPGLIFAMFGLRLFFKEKEQKAETLFILALCVTYLLFYSFFWNWEGDWTWGPRYLLPVFPFLILFSAPLFEKFGVGRRQGFYLSICAALAVNALGVFTHFDRYLLANYHAGVNQDWRFVPELSPLRGQFYLLASAVSQALGQPALTMDYLAWDPVRVAAIRAIIPLKDYSEFDLWWLRPANSGNWLVALIMGLLFAGLLWQAWRHFYRSYRMVKEFEGY